MSTVHDNQELAQDFIRLLRNENNGLRKQVQELEQRVSAKPPSYDDVNVIETLRRQCQELLAERESLQTRVTTLANAPCANTSHAHLASELDNARKQWTVQQSQLKDQHRRIMELQDTCHRLGKENEHLRKCGLESSIAEFDVKAFVRELPEHDNSKHPLYKGPFLNSVKLKLPKGAVELTPGLMRYSQSEVICKSLGASSFLAIGPMYAFKSGASKGEGHWDRAQNQQELVESGNKKRDILFLHNQAWHYYGTYECIGSTSLSAKKAEELGSTQMVAYAERRTLLGAERAPEYMPTLIHDLYVEGILQIECFGFKRVGFNEPLNRLLNGSGASDNKPRMTIPPSTMPKQPDGKKETSSQSTTKDENHI